MIKNILKVLMVVLVAGVFVFMIFKIVRGLDHNLSDKNKGIVNQIDTIQTQRDILSKEREFYKKEYDSLDKVDKLNISKIEILSKQLEKQKIGLDSSEVRIRRLKHQKDIIDKEIENLKHNPIKRVDGALINSLRKKLN
jgi:hypothetical protein